MFSSLKKMFSGGEKEREKILAPVEGKAVPLSEVSDPTFSQEILGKGVAIIPEKGRIVAPASGVLTVMFETKHAVSVTTDGGAEIIVHVGTIPPIRSRASMSRRESSLWSLTSTRSRKLATM